MCIDCAICGHQSNNLNLCSIRNNIFLGDILPSCCVEWKPDSNRIEMIAPSKPTIQSYHIINVIVALTEFCSSKNNNFKFKEKTTKIQSQTRNQTLVIVVAFFIDISSCCYLNVGFIQ